MNMNEESNLLAGDYNLFLKNTIETFYRKAFSPDDTDKTIYRVFLKRRCFVLACQYIRMHEVNPDVLETVCSDTGMRVVAQHMAKEFFVFRRRYPHKNIDEFPYRIRVYDNVLIYGRSLNRLLHECTKIFADTYINLQKSTSDFLTADLYRIFPEWVTIQTAFQNEDSFLLPQRYRKCLTESLNVCSPSVWRKFVFELAEIIFQSDIPNAAFIPALQFSSGCSADNIAAAFEQCRSEGLLSEFTMDRNDYRGRRLDTYTAVLSDENNIHFVFTIRCTEKYMIPFVFLPELSEKEADDIMTAFSLKYPGIFQRERQSYHHECLRSVYAELLNMLLAVAVLRFFLKKLDSHIHTGTLFLHTTADMMDYNYAHDPDVRRILADMLDPENPPPFSFEELKTLLYTAVEPKKCIFRGIEDITAMENTTVSDTLRQKTEKRTERIVFDCGIDSEINAYRMLKSPHVFYPARNLTTGRYLYRLYTYRDSWSRRAIPVSRAFSYLLQMMDAGCLSMTVETHHNQYVQCLRAGEQSLNMFTYRYAEYLPILNAIQLKCLQQGNYTVEGIFYELRFFFYACRKYGQTHGIDISRIENINRKYKPYLIYILYQMYRSGQNCSDSMYLTEKKLKALQVSVPPQEYIKTWELLYFIIS